MNSRVILAFFLILVSENLHGAEGQGGMPQLNPDSFSSQIFWLVVFFSILFVFVHYLFVPKISSIRSLRKNTIENYFNETKNLNIQIEKLTEQINQDSDENRDFCEKEIKVALDKSKNKISKELKKMDEEFDKKKIHLSEELLKSKHLLKKKIPGICIDLSDRLYERILGEKSESTSSDFEKITKDL